MLKIKAAKFGHIKIEKDFVFQNLAHWSMKTCFLHISEVLYLILS